uniref:Uncharacterized protein n=1 Tax=Meloidogyne enterolobii TaxID=390850 RepID=A0A6V7WEJ2_MELEN|nr:unnamed protein product [Meloidogyne enterolobii]
MEIFLNYLFILFAITFTLANNQNIEETENTTENVSVAPAGVKTRKIYKLGRDPKELKAEVDPLSTEVPWKKVNLSDVSNDTLNTDGFINVACYTELKAAPEKLYNKAFRFDVQKIFEKTNKHCMLRFPVGMYLQYRFKFSDPNTYAFWALGNSPNFTVGTTRLISSTEMYDQPFNWWKGEFKKLEKSKKLKM